MDTSSLVASSLTLLAAFLALARSRVVSASILTHWLGSHGTRIGSRRFSEVVAELVGVVALGFPVRQYSEDHRLHHGLATFATLADPDARFLYNLGLRPGRSYEELRRQFFVNLVSWRLHGPLGWARLKATFGPDQPGWRRAVALVFWGGLLAAAAVGGWLTGLLGTVVLGLGFFGQIASYVQLCAEHSWMTTNLQGTARQAGLSHTRTLIGWLPLPGAPWWRWLLMPFSLLGAIVARSVVLVADLHAHDRHHANARPQMHLDAVGWTNGAYEYPEVDHPPRRRFASLWAAIRAWLMALSQEQPLDRR